MSVEDRVTIELFAWTWVSMALLCGLVYLSIGTAKEVIFDSR